MSGREQFEGWRALPAYLRALGRYLRARFVLGFAAGSRQPLRPSPAAFAEPPRRPAPLGYVRAVDSFETGYREFAREVGQFGRMADESVRETGSPRRPARGPRPCEQSGAYGVAIALAEEAVTRGWITPGGLVELAQAVVSAPDYHARRVLNWPELNSQTVKILGHTVEVRRDTAPPETGNNGTR